MTVFSLLTRALYPSILTLLSCPLLSWATYMWKKAWHMPVAFVLFAACHLKRKNSGAKGIPYAWPLHHRPESVGGNTAEEGKEGPSSSAHGLLREEKTSLWGPDMLACGGRPLWGCCASPTYTIPHTCLPGRRKGRLLSSPPFSGQRRHCLFACHPFTCLPPSSIFLLFPLKHETFTHVLEKKHTQRTMPPFSSVTPFCTHGRHRGRQGRNRAQCQQAVRQAGAPISKAKTPVVTRGSSQTDIHLPTAGQKLCLLHHSLT